MKNLNTLILLLLLTSCATNNTPPTEEVIAPLQESKTSNSETTQDRANSDEVEKLKTAYARVMLAEILNRKCGYEEGNNVKVLALAKLYLNLMIIKIIGPDLTNEQVKDVYFETNDPESERLSAGSIAETQTCEPDALEFFNDTTKRAEQMLKVWDALPDE